MGVDPRTRIIYQFPVLFVADNCRIKGPEAAYLWLHRMDLAAFLAVVQDTETVRSGPQVGSTLLFKTKPGEKVLWGQVKKMGDFFHFFWIEKNSAPAVTALTAHAAFKGFHFNSSSRFQSTRSRTRFSACFCLYTRCPFSRPN